MVESAQVEGVGKVSAQCVDDQLLLSPIERSLSDLDTELGDSHSSRTPWSSPALER